jgi:hypothetical protein
MIKHAKALFTVTCQGRLKNSQWIVCAEECGDIHVNARLGLIIKIIPDVYPLVYVVIMPDVHVMAVKTSRPHGVENDTFTIGFHVQGKILRIVIIARPVIGTELVRLHAGSQKWQQINTKSACLNHPRDVGRSGDERA